VILPGPDDHGGPDQGRRRARPGGIGDPSTSTNRPHGRARRDRRTTLRIAAALLGLLALAAGLVTAVAVSASRPSPGVPLLPAAATAAPTTGTEHGTRPIRPYPDLPSRTGAATGGTDTGGTTGTGTTDDTGRPGDSVTVTSPAPSTAAPSTPPQSELPPADSAGGVKAARARVSDFVAALNDNDPERANSFLCSDLAGSFGNGMLNGVEPGSLGVGGVSVRGDSGTAYVTYRPTGGGETGRAMFGLVVEHAQWMICDPPN
jgi:hypothetical protein